MALAALLALASDPATRRGHAIGVIETDGVRYIALARQFQAVGNPFDPVVSSAVSDDRRARALDGSRLGDGRRDSWRPRSAWRLLVPALGAGPRCHRAPGGLC